MNRLLILHTDSDHTVDPADLAGFQRFGGELVQIRTRDDFLVNAPYTVAVINSNFRLTSDLIDELKVCRVISRYGSGYDNIDVEAASRRGIPVCNVPVFCVEEVANRAMTLLLAGACQLPWLDRFTRSGEWGVDQIPHTLQIEGQVLGIVGFGKIGRSLAWRAKAFGLKVAAYDPYLEREHIVAQGAAPFELEDLLSVADFVSLHLPLSEGTFHMIDARRLALMKPSAILINTARGAIIDESALLETLTRRRIAGAALDVFEHEPPGSGNPLFALDNVVLTPHCAAHTQLATDKVRRGALDNVHRALRNQPLENVVNRSALRSQAASISSARLKPV